MKHFGNYIQHRKQRNDDLIRAYRQQLHRSKVIRLDEIWHKIADMPSKRFWVSEERAAIVISKMMKGDTLHNMRPLKKEMFQEIYNRVNHIRKKQPSISVYKCCIVACNSPAPKFYMTPLSIRQTIYKIKKEWKKQQKH